MYHNCPLHQRLKWQLDESRGRDEQNSHSYWTLTSSKSQTTCKERDSPLSSANSYISNSSTSPWALPEHPDTLKYCSVLEVFCVKYVLVCCVCLEICGCWRTEKHLHCSEESHTLSTIVFWDKDLGILCLLLSGFAIMRHVIFLVFFWSWMRGDMVRHLSRYLVRDDSGPQQCPLRSDPSVVVSVGLISTHNTDHL